MSETKYISQQTFNIVIGIAIAVIGTIFAMSLGVKNDLAEMKGDVKVLKNEVSWIKDDVSWIKDKLGGNKSVSSNINYSNLWKQ